MTKTTKAETTKKIPTMQASVEGVTVNSNFCAKYGVIKNPSTLLAIGIKSEIKPMIPFKTRGNPIRIMLFSCKGRFFCRLLRS